jgi:hypothetical protein
MRQSSDRAGSAPHDHERAGDGGDHRPRAERLVCLQPRRRPEWGPGGGFIDIQSERGDGFHYSPFAKAGKYKTTVAQPLVVQVGVGPAVKIVTSAAGECTVTITRADDTGVAGSFECGAIAVLGPEKKNLGAIESMTGSFSAAK